MDVSRASTPKSHSCYARTCRANSRYSSVGTRTEKTLEAPRRTLLMDVGQVERYLCASIRYTLGVFILSDKFLP